MNPQPPSDGTPPPPSPREEFEARLAALALGESGEFDAETLRARLAADPELAALYRRFEAAALAYKNTFEDERAAAALPPLEPPPEHLSADRAARLAKIFAGTAPEVSAAPVETPTAPRQRRPRKILPFPAWVQIFAAAACLVLLAVMLIPASNTSVHLSKALLQQSAASPSTPERVASAASAKATTNEPQPQPAPVALNFQTPTAADASNASRATPIMSAAQLARSLDNENKTVRDDAGAGTGGGAEPFFTTNGSLLAKDQSLEPQAGPPPGAPMMQSGPALAANTPPVNAWANTDPQMLRDFQVGIAGGNNEASASAPMPTEAPPMPPPPPPPPPPPAVAANNYRGNAFGGQGGPGGFGGGARRGGFGGGAGGRMAGAGRGGRAGIAGAPAPSAATPADTSPAEAEALAANTITVEPNLSANYAGNISGAGNLARNAAGSNNFGGDAGLRSGNGLADAGGQGGVAGNDQRAANSFDNRNAGAAPITGVSSANSLIRGGTESYGNNAFSGNMYVQGGNVILDRNVALNNTTGNYIVGGGNLGFGNLTAATTGGLPGNQNAGANNYNGANNAGTPEAPGIVAFALGGIASEANSGGNLAQNGGGMVFSGGGLQWAAGTSTDISNSIQGQFVNVQANLTPNGGDTLDTGSGGVAKTGTGILTLSGSNTYSGGTTIAGGGGGKEGGGTLAINQDETGGGVLISGNGVVQLGNGTANGTMTGNAAKTSGDSSSLGGINTYTGSTTVTGGTLTLNETINRQSGDVLLDQGTLLAGNGRIANNNPGTGYGLTKAGTGCLTLSGTNTFNGTTSINAGTLQMGSGSAFGPAGNTFTAGNVTAAGGTLQLGNYTGGNAANLTNNGAPSFNEPPAASDSSTAILSGTLYVGDSTKRPMITGGDVTLYAPTPANSGAPVISNNALPPTPASNLGTITTGSGTLIITGGTLDNTSGGASNTPGQTVANNVSQQIATAAPTAPVPALMPAAPPTSEPGFQDNAKKAEDTDQPVARPRSVVKFPAPVNTADNAFSTFALNVNDVSYQLARTALQNHRWPDPGATRTEEFLNAFNYHDPAPATGEACALHYDLGQNPIESGGDLLRVSFQTAAAGRDRATPLRLTILLDNSGSMTRSDRSATLLAALRALGGLLRPGDTVSLVTFARTPQVRLTALPAERFGEILSLLSSLQPEGGTNMEEALRTTYATARGNFDPNAQNRVVLLTDGAANLGELNPAALAGIVEENRRAGIALDAYGVGWDGYDDTTLEALTRKSDGRYAFLSGPGDVDAAFAAKLAGALTPAANDVKLQIEFNPQRVTSYRLMGYNNLQLTQVQFRDNTVNAGELAAADQGTALYNLVLNPSGAGPIGTARVRYRDPGTNNYHELSWTIPYNRLPPAFDQAPPALRLAAVAGYFAEYLQQSPYAAGTNPRALLTLLGDTPKAFAPDAKPAGLADLLTTAASLAGN